MAFTFSIHLCIDFRLDTSSCYHFLFASLPRFPLKAALPIDGVIDELLTRVREAGAVVLRAPTGAGKTTRVPLALLQEGFARTGRIVLLEPRRVAARAAARRMASELGSELGDEVGYHVRFDRKFGSRTSILVVTPGILLRMMQDDPYLESVAMILFDEIHERGIENDLALGMALLSQRTVRDDLKLLAMSATLDTARLSNYLGSAPLVESEGRLFPVEIRYRPPGRDESILEAAHRETLELIAKTNGDLLIFLPGVGEIRQLTARLESLAQDEDLLLFPLYGDLSPEQQDRALVRHARRKIVLATNVAETSVTVEGVTAVIDTGLARVMRFDPSVGLDRLELEPISRSACEQRTGRAGRLAPGICIRLWSEFSHPARPLQTEPEIARVDLAPALLQLFSLGESDPFQFPWLDAPPRDAVEHSLQLLEMLGAIRDRTITDLGQQLAKLPVHPRLGRLLIETGFSRRAALAAALLGERDIFLRGSGGRVASTHSDLLDRLELIEQFARTRQTRTPLGEINSAAVRTVFQVQEQLLREVSSSPDDDESLLKGLLSAFPDRVVRRRERGSDRGVMVGGRGVKMAPSSGVIEPEFFLAISVDAGGVESFVRLASSIERDWLPREFVHTETVCDFDASTERLVAWKRTFYRDLLLDETSAAVPKSTESREILQAAAIERLESVLPAVDSAAGNWLGRIRFLNEFLPEAGLPKFDREELAELLPDLAPNARSFEELRRADWLGVLKGRCRFDQLQLIEREAPEKMLVPSGSEIALEYEPGRPPILQVRIQELFGLKETPRLARGKVKILLHLLAPNFRPQQVTDDLASFWVNTYPQVRKELRARYPKHSWPEDPLTAEPLRGAKRRKPDHG
jgi:ATP-dependent helicase HrpB